MPLTAVIVCLSLYIPPTPGRIMVRLGGDLQKTKFPPLGHFLTFTNPLLWVRGKVEICHRLENVQSTSGVIFSVKCPTYSPTIAQPDIQYTAVTRYSL